MSTSDIPAALQKALSPVVAAEGLYLERVRLGGHQRKQVVTVVVDLPDGPGAVDSDQLADVSRAVSARMDEVDDLLPGAYELEVTTPGVSRPLTERRHFRRAEGRLVTVQTQEGSVRGRVITAADDGLQVQPEPERSKPGKGQNRRPEPMLLPWEAVRRGKVEVEFKRAGHGG